MLKNKDGSYNKISITILLSILVIGLGIIISSLLSIDENILLSIFILIAIISISGLLCYIFITKRKQNVVHHTITVQPVIDTIKSKEPQIKLVKKSSSDFEYTGLISPLITFIIATVTFMVGFSIVNSMISSMPTLPEGSEFATQQAAVNETVLSAFNIIPLMLLIGAIGMIIAIMFKFVANDGDYK